MSETVDPSNIEEDYDDLADDWDIPDPEVELEDWAETWLDGIDPDDVEGYKPDVWIGE